MSRLLMPRFLLGFAYAATLWMATAPAALAQPAPAQPAPAQPAPAQPAPAQPAPAAAIEWEVAHRYRLFRNEGHFREILRHYRGLNAAQKRDTPAMALEVALEKASAEARLPRALFGDPWAIDRYGWTSALLNETCFQSGNKGHFLCRLYAIDENGRLQLDKKGTRVLGEAFMAPKATDILARLTNPSALPAGATCQWSAGAARASAPCTAEARLKNLPFDTDFTLEVRGPDGILIAATAGPQRAKHVFIAGLGDSFASGEGNPDKPAWLSGELGYGSDYAKSSPLPPPLRGYRQYPTRARSDGGETGGWGQPVWLNGQCHRSLYSQHVRASLGLALEQPHLAVSFTGYACTGAETQEGILGYWKGRPDVSPRFRDDSPQLMRLLRDYCASPAAYSEFEEDEDFSWKSLKPCKTWRTRPPDVVLLSIGGNDIGFARVIAGQTIGHHDIKPPGSWSAAVSLWTKAAKPLSFKQSEDMLKALFPKNLRELRQALDTYLRPASGEAPAYRLVQTGYPLLTSMSSGTCKASVKGMDVHAALKTSDETGPEGARFVRRFNEKLQDAAEDLGTPRWVFTAAHAEKFIGHAICQPGAPEVNDFTAAGYDPKISGGLDFPTLLDPYHPTKRRWHPFKPDDWRAYRPRNRWFVAPNDGFLTGHYLSSDFDASDRAQPLIAATLSGAFHPNALGHAATADVVLPELRKHLGLKRPGE